MAAKKRSNKELNEELDSFAAKVKILENLFKDLTSKDNVKKDENEKYGVIEKKLNNIEDRIEDINEKTKFSADKTKFDCK